MKAKRNLNILKSNLTMALILGGMLFSAGALAAKPVTQGSSGATKPARGFATVGDAVITWRDYRNAYTRLASKKFYHGKPGDDEMAAFQRQVGNDLINNVLLEKEAQRRKLKPNDAVVNEELQKYDQQFANDPKWPGARPRVLPLIAKKLQGEEIRNQLEKLVRDVPPPTMQQLRQYYDAHPEKFTSPSQPRVSIILLRVDPGATQDDWKKAMEEGQGLVKRIRAGEDFAAMARNYSSDETADAGGDMGFLHAGMLPGLPEEIVGKLLPGETSDPVKLLEGVAIFRLTGRIQPAPGSFETSQQRVKELWLGEQSDIAWNSLIAKLRKNTTIRMDESRFLPLPAAAKKPTGKPAKNDETTPATK